jgi:predicted bacteriocin transport accessory protein
MDKVKKFFSKIGKWFKKAWIVCSNFFRENVWAGVLGIVVGILLFILIVQGLVKAIDNCSNKTSESSVANHATTITTSQLKEKLSNGDTFVLFIGSNSCSHCKEFYTTVNKYVSSGNTIYYIDIADDSDPLISKYVNELEEMLLAIPDVEDGNRSITSLATPTTVYVKDGEFADAIQGAYGMSGGTNYTIFCDVVEGKYIGKTYTLESE